ncbi:MAG: hypothetical protein Q9224_003177 [Gallowayella concinna]
MQSVDYAATAHHHRPWGMGDSSDFVGTFSTLDEAKCAAQGRYHQEKIYAEGWEHVWQSHDRYPIWWLKAKREDGEADIETLTVTVKKVQQRRQEPPQPQRSEPYTVWVLRIDHKCDGDLRDVQTRAVFSNLRDANEAATKEYRRLCGEIHQDPDEDSGVETASGELSFLVEYDLVECNVGQEDSWVIHLERRTCK